MTGKRPRSQRRQDFWIITTSIIVFLMLLGGCSAYVLHGLRTIQVPEGQKTPAEILAAAKTIPTVEGLTPKGEFSDSCTDINATLCSHSAYRHYVVNIVSAQEPTQVCRVVQQQLLSFVDSLTKIGPSWRGPFGTWSITDCASHLGGSQASYAASAPGKQTLFGDSYVSVLLGGGELQLDVERSG